MVLLIERSSRDSDEPTIVLETSTPGTFCNVRANAVCSSNQLLSNRVLCQHSPILNGRPNQVRQPFRQPIDIEFFEPQRRHGAFHKGQRTNDYLAIFMTTSI